MAPLHHPALIAAALAALLTTPAAWAAPAASPAGGGLADVEALQEQLAMRGRAANLARMRAEALNGGLSRYRAQSCMHDRGGGPCLVSSSAKGLRFRFLGGPPGWQQFNQPASVETEILIAPDGRQVLQLIYNGPPR
jgi:hypothetical protein